MAKIFKAFKSHSMQPFRASENMLFHKSKGMKYTLGLLTANKVVGNFSFGDWGFGLTRELLQGALAYCSVEMAMDIDLWNFHKEII